jgi:hypothetical protein
MKNMLGAGCWVLDAGLHEASLYLSYFMEKQCILTPGGASRTATRGTRVTIMKTKKNFDLRLS